MSEGAVSGQRAALAAWLREGLVKLGPTFIKIGQQFSTRVDVLSPEFIKELEKLQDNVPAFESETAVQIVESTLGKPLDQLFEEFDPQPIAAASLGQVHVAKIGGEKVVVKVQRPGLKDLFDIDLKNVRVLAQFLQKVRGSCNTLLNAPRPGMCVRGRCVCGGVPGAAVAVAAAIGCWLAYAPGVKINRVKELDRMGVDRTLLAQRAVESYLQQLLNHGFFHADPHPGNIAVDAEGGGRLIYYDFGMMGTIPSDIRWGGGNPRLWETLRRPTRGCADAASRLLHPIRATFQSRHRHQPALAPPRLLSSPSCPSFLPAGEDLLVASADKPFRFPATFTFVVRSFTVLDGIGKGLNPRFDMTEIAAPYARQLLLEGSSLQNRAVANLFKGPNMIEDTYTVMQQLERGDLKLRVRALEAERALTR
ncbi:hypothetical protein CHLNCDRAFT_33282, partial [Chlorella variabilis]